MRVSIIVGPDGVERVVSVGPGLQSTGESLFLLSVIWGEVRGFHRAVVRKLKQSHGGADKGTDKGPPPCWVHAKPTGEAARAKP